MMCSRWHKCNKFSLKYYLSYSCYAVIFNFNDASELFINYKLKKWQLEHLKNVPL